MLIYYDFNMSMNFFQLKKIISQSNSKLLNQLNMINKSESQKDILSKNECYDKMSDLFEELKKRVPNNEIRMYFTTEKYKNRKGHHNHIILFVENKNWLVESLIIDELFINDRVDFKPYDKYNSGLFYIGKENSKGTDWDIFSTKKID